MATTVSSWPHSSQRLKLIHGGGILRTKGLTNSFLEAQRKAAEAKASRETHAFHSLPEDETRNQILPAIAAGQYKIAARYLTSWPCSEVANISPEVRIRPGAGSPSSSTAAATSASDSGTPLATHAAGPTSSSSHTGSRSGSSRKRKEQAPSGEDDQSQDDDMRREPPRRPRRRGDDDNQRGRFLLACPFLKKDPVRWRPCCRLALRRIRDVKQHLRRAHSVAPQGITGQQREQLGRRASPALPEPEQWFAVFDVVFPGEPRPPSPYVDPDVSEDLASYLAFEAARGAGVVRRSIIRHHQHAAGSGSSALPLVGDDVDDETLESLVRRGLDDLRDEWALGRRSASVRASTSRSSRPPSPRPEAEQTSAVTETHEHAEDEEDLGVMNKLRPLLSGTQGGSTQDPADLDDSASQNLVPFEHVP